MTRKIEVPNADDIVQFYIAGETVNKLASKFGINRKVIYRLIAERGVVKSQRIDIPELPDILTRYIAGESEQSLSLEFGLSRTVLRRRIIEAGITPRTISDTMKMRWKSASSDQRARMLNPAHNATKGITPTQARMAKAALTRQINKSRDSVVERYLIAMLQERGISVIPQLAVGIYNIDIAINESSIAVEIFGGGWHASGKHAARFFERNKYILNQGWSLIIVWLDARHYPLGVGCADYIVARIEELRLNPSLVSQYWVIRGNGNLAPISDKNFNTPAVIKRLRGSN